MTLVCVNIGDVNFDNLIKGVSARKVNCFSLCNYEVSREKIFLRLSCSLPDSHPLVLALIDDSCLNQLLL